MSGLCFSLFVKYLILQSLKLKPPYLPERLINTVLIYLQWCSRSDMKLYLKRLNICWRKIVDQLLIHCPFSVCKWHWISRYFLSAEIHATDQATRILLPDTPLPITMNLTVCIKTLFLHFNGVKETIHTLLIEINRGEVFSTTSISSDYFLNSKMECALPTWSFIFQFSFLFMFIGQQVVLYSHWLLLWIGTVCTWMRHSHSMSITFVRVL